MTTETKVEAATRYRLDVDVVGMTIHPIAVSDANGAYVLFAQHQSALDALRGEVSDRKARHERTERDACMWASRAESAEKRSDAAERRVEELEQVIREVLDVVKKGRSVGFEHPMTASEIIMEQILPKVTP